jgi:hypothetical protein
MRRPISPRSLVGQSGHGIGIDKVDLASTISASFEDLAKHPVLKKIAGVATKCGHFNLT